MTMTDAEWWCMVSFHPDELRHEAYARDYGVNDPLLKRVQEASDEELKTVTEWIMHDERLWDMFTALIMEGFEWKFGDKNVRP